MFNTSELYRRQSNKGRDYVTRVLDEHPNDKGRVRVQDVTHLLYGHFPSDFDPAKLAQTMGQSVIEVPAKSIRETIQSLMDKAKEREDNRPHISYVRESGGLVQTHKDWTLPRDEAELLGDYEGTITFTCAKCKERNSVATKGLEVNTEETACGDGCCWGTAVDVTVTCPTCSAPNEIALYDS